MTELIDEPDHRVELDSGTGWFVGIIVALALLALGYLFFSDGDSRPSPALATAHVKVSTEKGHGSATHIGNGYFVTAAHVVDGAGRAGIDLGGNLSYGLVTLWSNRGYDIALLRGPADKFAAVPLACATPPVGTEGVSFGNPMALDGIQTGLRVAGEPRELSHWARVVPVDGAVAPGMSGGGFIADGHLVGVNVGTMMAPTTIGMPSYIGIGLVVPGAVVCELMARQ